MAGLVCVNLASCAEDEQMLGFKALTAASDEPERKPTGKKTPQSGDEPAFGCSECVPDTESGLATADALSSIDTTPEHPPEAGPGPAYLAQPHPPPPASSDALSVAPEAGDRVIPTAEPPLPPEDRDPPETGTSDDECQYVIAFSTLQECMGKRVCVDHESTSTCLRLGSRQPWTCDAARTPFDGAAASQQKYLLQNVPEELSPCRVALGLLDNGSPWDVASGFDCDEQGSADDYACEFTPGCWHALDLDEGQLSVWEPSDPGIACTKLETPTGALSCGCAAGEQAGVQIEVQGTEAPNACYDAQIVCSVATELTFEGEETCTVATRVLEPQYCSLGLECGRTAEFGPLTLRPLVPREVICSAAGDGVSTCFCNASEVATLSFDVQSTISDELCTSAGSVCYPFPTLTQSSPRVCPVDGTLLNADSCEARLACSWPALAGELEVDAHAQADLHCDALAAQDGRDAVWACTCGVASQLFEPVDFEHVLGADREADCLDMAARCAEIAEEQDESFDSR